METTSPELQEIITVIRQEHRRTQLVFGISIIILAVVIMFIAPGVINMESNRSSGGQDLGSDPGASLPGSANASPHTPAASSTATSSTAH